MVWGKTIGATIATLLLLTGCEIHYKNAIHMTSVIQLVANPTDFIGYKVSFSGFLAENGGNYIVMASRNGVWPPDIVDGVYLEFLRNDQNLESMAACIGKQVHVIGEFGITRTMQIYGIKTPHSIYAASGGTGERPNCLPDVLSAG